MALSFLYLRSCSGVPCRIPLIRTSWLPGRIVGLSLGVAILLDPRYFYDEPTIRHELMHCRQFWRNGLIFHFLRYWLSKKYRLQAEVEAFREELAYINEAAYESQLRDFATALSESYGLSIGQSQAKNLLDINSNNLG